MNVQLIPEPFVEIPVELAAELGIKGNDKVKVTSARSYYIAKAFVTKRIKPMMIDGKKIYQIGIPIHQGYRGIQEDEGRNARTILRTGSRRRSSIRTRSRRSSRAFWSSWKRLIGEVSNYQLL